MSEFLAKWVGAAFLLGFAWGARRADRRRALGLGLAALALLAFEVGTAESLLELLAAALIGREAGRMGDAPGRWATRIGAGLSLAALVWFAIAPWVTAAGGTFGSPG